MRHGELTRNRSNRMVRTPGGRTVVHRRKMYSPGGTCTLCDSKMELPREAKHGLSRTASHSSKRPNRPYGGVATSRAVRRGTIRSLRGQ
ncbi:MAG: 50S ribosomal protein L34e [Candidatus Thorarchaeota archaeon]|nr:MAG: 50S ribosomal protein L34e [Candidatus Thorarchaeota archaeon]